MLSKFQQIHPQKRERPTRRWEDNIRMDLNKNRYQCEIWVDRAQDRDYWRALVSAI